MANKKGIYMTFKDFFREHKELLKTLKSGKKKALQKEYKEQKEELKKVKINYKKK